jgi:hypothetical protein
MPCAGVIIIASDIVCGVEMAGGNDLKGDIVLNAERADALPVNSAINSKQENAKTNSLTVETNHLIPKLEFATGLS